MDDLPEEEITFLLRAWGNGQDGTLEKLLPLIHGELRALAQRLMQRERPGHTLQTHCLSERGLLALDADSRYTLVQPRSLLCSVGPNHAAYSGRSGTLKTRSEAARSRMPNRIG